MHLFVCYLAGLPRNYRTNHYETWWKDEVCVREELIIFSCGSGSGGRSTHVFSLSLRL